MVSRSDRHPQFAWTPSVKPLLLTQTFNFCWNVCETVTSNVSKKTQGYRRTCQCFMNCRKLTDWSSEDKTSSFCRQASPESVSTYCTLWDIREKLTWLLLLRSHFGFHTWTLSFLLSAEAAKSANKLNQTNGKNHTAFDQLQNMPSKRLPSITRDLCQMVTMCLWFWIFWRDLRKFISLRPQAGKKTNHILIDT